MKARRPMLTVLCFQRWLVCSHVQALRAAAFSRSVRVSPTTTVYQRQHHHLASKANGVVLRSTATTTDANIASSPINSISQLSLQDPLLIHWKGETNEGYSIQFRHDEFQGALEAVVQQKYHLPSAPSVSLRFDNALHYTGTPQLDNMPEHKLLRYEEAMQYLQITEEQSSSSSSMPSITQQDVIQAAERCSLIHAIYQVVAESDSYQGLAEKALEKHSLQDLQKGYENEHATWCVRVRQYGDGTKQHKLKRHGEKSTRSVSAEKVALKALTPLLLTLGGAVRLKDTDVKLYVMEGIIPPTLLSSTSTTFDDDADNNENASTMILSRRIARGPKVSTIAPVTRICVTNTPLCPTAAYLMCNLGRLSAGATILDPYGGSCAILLAAGMMEPTVRSVAIEIAHNGLVNRTNILRDFETRQIPPPVGLLQGDCTDAKIRADARALVNDSDDDGFSLIITDPPYGIRESKNYNAQTPIQELLSAIIYDRDVVQRRMLKVGGKLVVFLPCSHEEESFEDDVLPTKDELERAGLELRYTKEQPLNDLLSRWLVVFDCVG